MLLILDVGLPQVSSTGIRHVLSIATRSVCKTWLTYIGCGKARPRLALSCRAMFRFSGHFVRAKKITHQRSLWFTGVNFGTVRCGSYSGMVFADRHLSKYQVLVLHCLSVLRLIANRKDAKKTVSSSLSLLFVYSGLLITFSTRRQ